MHICVCVGEHTFSSSIQIYYTLGHKASLKTLQKIIIKKTVLNDPNAIKLEIIKKQQEIIPHIWKFQNTSK